MKKLKIAVTGSIGSGKSAFCDLLGKKGFTVISADNIAKEILAADPEVRNQIIDAFGKEAYTVDGPDIKYLAENVFTDPENVKKINGIVHPPTITKINQLMEADLKDNNFVFVESALIYEANLEDLFDYVVVINADEKTRIDRVMTRDEVEEEEVHRRMDHQMSDKFKADNADFVIENSSSMADLENRTDFILVLFNSLSN